MKCLLYRFESIRGVQLGVEAGVETGVEAIAGVVTAVLLSQTPIYTFLIHLLFMFLWCDQVGHAVFIEKIYYENVY